MAGLGIEAARSLVCVSKEDFTMSHVIRLQLIGRVTYYVGWIALVCGGLFHLNIATKLFLAVNRVLPVSLRKFSLDHSIFQFVD